MKEIYTYQVPGGSNNIDDVLTVFCYQGTPP